jgi:hypothetical protein
LRLAFEPAAERFADVLAVFATLRAPFDAALAVRFAPEAVRFALCFA